MSCRYILIYPQGCDVCNFLSLFLCVANHDKLLPGWSHFAQFTIAVVNIDPKKSKYSDTLHRFWKKEHDWGWKKFMESKMVDGFIQGDTIIFKVQVQVIRERVDRPFRCLDRQYRRELVKVYSANVEQICRRYVEQIKERLRKLINDKARWSRYSRVGEVGTSDSSGLTGINRIGLFMYNFKFLYIYTYIFIRIFLSGQVLTGIWEVLAGICVFFRFFLIFSDFFVFFPDFFRFFPAD
ncbi:putative MATH/TRAF domain-containing protein [Helianthus anomalus]